MIYALLTFFVGFAASLIYGLAYSDWRPHTRCLSCNRGIEREKITYRDRFGSNVPICPHCGEDRPGAISSDQVGRWAYGRWQWKNSTSTGMFRMNINGSAEDIHAVYARADGKLVAVRYGGNHREWLLSPGSVEHQPEPLEALAALSQSA